MDKQNERLAVAAAASEYQTQLAAMINAKAVLKTRVLAAIAAGVSENEAAKLSGVTRKTVRDWQGKDPHIK